MTQHYRLCFLGYCLGISGCLAQRTDSLRSTFFRAELGSYITSQTSVPFWLRTNQYGIVPLKGSIGTIRLGAYSDYRSFKTNEKAGSRRRFDWGYGTEVVANGGVANQLILPEAYVKIRYGTVEFYAGRRRELFGLADSTLSTGSYAWSGNALPVPKVQLEIRSFKPLGFTKNFVAIKGSFAHGWLGGRFVQHTLLHQKSFYIRLGKPASRFKAYGGLNHQVVWGGESPDLLKIGLITSEQLPSSFKDYLSLVSGLRSSDSGITNAAAYTDFDLTNRVGNHLGSVDIALELATNSLTYYLYRQNPYETGALFYGTSLADGLNGLRIRSRNPKAVIQQVLIEYLNTANQGGDEFIINDPQHRGRVDYFNHAQFRDGWSYQGLGIGTPFIPPALGPNNALPYGTFTSDNRVQVWHLGIMGNLFPRTHRWLSGPVTIQSKLSYSRNLGTYTIPYPQPIYQFSGILTVAAPLIWLQGLQATSSFALDEGGLYPTAAGFYIGIRKEWSTSTAKR
ncbi:capsule assembly Wzi family protein [Spirosoma sp. HMF4905]|uniref:Capsule assembly Wzi family protein n=1 Tax=Spirosoma arboris TaxID=2682092 RepID=A0A7K1SGJ6_9BACT|nr:capsule assembly Wzi family protein [Spirosoma arboris]MVM32838.1 capsule assembly Wzi family protein [Spirosoma arboris]